MISTRLLIAATFSFHIVKGRKWGKLNSVKSAANSRINLQEGGKQNQTDEKSLHPPKKSPKNRQGITNLNLQNEKETNCQKQDLSTKKLEGVRPPPLLLPHGQSLATLQLNLAELSHIRRQVGFKYLNFQFNSQTGVKRLAGGKKSKRKSEN